MMKLSESMKQGHFNFFQYLRGVRKARRTTAMASVSSGVFIWASPLVGMLVFVFGLDLIGEVLEEGATLFVEFLQETLESFYHKQFKLDLYHSQMATAYTGFVIMLGAGYFVSQKVSSVLHAVRDSWDSGREKAMDVCANYWDKFMGWWDSMDSFNKCFALIGFVVVAIPLVSIACIVLGKVVAELI